MLWFHITIPEGGVKYSNTVRKLQGESSTDLVASGKLFSGARLSLIHNISSPEGVIFPITAKEIGNQTLGWTCRVHKLKCDYWTSIRQHLLHWVHHKWVLEWREGKSDPEIIISLTLKTFSATISRVCFSYPFAKLCSWAASKTQGWISIWHKSSAVQWSYDNVPKQNPSRGNKLHLERQNSQGRAEHCLWPGSAGDLGTGHVLWGAQGCERQRESPSKAAACFGQGNCFLCMARWAFVFD